MVKKFREIPVGTIAFLENDTTSIKIPRVNAIRRIMLRFFVEVTSIATEPVEIEDTILKVIKKVRIVFDGDENKINVDARKLFYVEKIEKGTEPPTNKDDDQSTSTTKVWFVSLALDFATNRRDETDISALLAARKFSKLDLEIDWGDIDDMFSVSTATTIAAANSGCEVEVREVIDTENKVSFAKGQLDKGFIDMRESTFSKDVDKAYDNFDDDALEIDIKPAPVTILKHLLLFVNSSDALTNTASATDVAVIDTRGAGETILKRDLVMLNREMKTEYALESNDPGVVLLDWIDKLGGGLANIDTEGALKFKFKAGTPSGTPKVLGFTRYIAGRTLAKVANV